MPTGVPLGSLVVQLRSRMLQSVNPAHSVNTLPQYREILESQQRQLWLEHAWTHLRVDRDTPLLAGERYYDWPDDLDINRVEDVWSIYNNRWHRLRRGISPDQYNGFDSDRDVRADPAARWAPYGTNQVEFWPIPVSDGLQTARMRGIKNLAPLVDDADLCDIDSDLIVLTTAAELLAEMKSARAGLVAAKAQSLYNRLKQRGESNDDGPEDGVINLGMPRPHRDRGRRPPPLVAVDRGGGGAGVGGAAGGRLDIDFVLDASVLA